MPTAETVYREYFDQVYRFALTRTPSTEDAQDVVSRVFTKVVEHIDQFSPREGATVRSWVFAILRNELIDFYRRQKPSFDLDSTIEEGYTPEHNEYIDQRQDLQKVFAAMRNLPDRQREIVLLKYQADLKNKEIARILDVNERTVSAALSRALQTLRLYFTF